MNAFVHLIGLDPLDEAATDPSTLDEAVRDRMFRFGAFSLSVVVLIYVAIHIIDARWRALGADALLLTAIFLCAVYDRLTRNHFIALNAMNLSLFVIVCYQGYLQGLLNTSAFWWLSVLPFIAIVSGARVLAAVQLTAFVALAGVPLFSVPKVTVRLCP
ncbi:hypothetical protein [Methylibium petroleiphilum]|uniref:Uncharacterized protein n=1 Tax=Methylibium petroleiphilum (strain ATCC BAA-1232 / LMG 22953 / PM1) TaxID=420662 RepID=A2SNQ3_METPP|nr:hypothetical protein [Methylibium petroleiphilum]ABM97192.1 hypothetical protein Mpe_B0417 [Methylibium petroleiphilum PM1]